MELTKEELVAESNKTRNIIIALSVIVGITIIIIVLLAILLPGKGQTSSSSDNLCDQNTGRPLGCSCLTNGECASLTCRGVCVTI